MIFNYDFLENYNSLQKKNKQATKQMNNNKQYSARDMVVSVIYTWTETLAYFDHQYSTIDTLEKVKEACKEYELDIHEVKSIFDEVEHPFYYDIEKDEIFNSDDICDDCGKEEDECEC